MTTTRVLAVASGGGHWVQLLRLRPAFDDAEVVYVTVDDAYRCQVEPARFHRVPDATQWDRFKLVLLALRLLWVLALERPHLIISTGAAPGYLALRLGGLMGARTLWLDSIANVEELSRSGRMIGSHVDTLLTQWEHLAEPGGAQYRGSVL
jgi:UDP-N-acetylglucosamine:LPS N-acetylglucosamine transferase